MTRQLEGRARVEHYLAAGGKLTDPDTVIPRFDAQQLVEAMSFEMARAASIGQTRITLNIDMLDAVAMVAYLRRAIARGA
jgi:hypothetical protein